MLIRHVAAVCRVEVTKHGKQDYAAKLRAVIQKGEPGSASLHNMQAANLPEMVKPAWIEKESAKASVQPAGVIADSA